MNNDTPQEQPQYISGTIQELGANGDGLLIHEDEKYYLPFTAPGDTVTFEVITHKKWVRYRVHENDHGSSWRISPACPHFETCGGCRLQHIHEDHYRDFKVQQLQRALDFHRVQAQVMHPLHVIPARERRRISLTFAHRQEQMRLGYMRRGSRWIVDIQTCPLVHPAIEAIVPPLRILLAQLFQRGESGHLDILLSHTGLDVNIKTGYLKHPTLEQTEQLTEFARSHDLARLLLNYRPIVTFRTPIISFSGVPVEVEAGKFLQASDAADDFMLKTMADYVPKTLSRAADLFSGRGTFTFLLAQYAPTDAFECEQDALAALQQAGRKSGVPATAIKRDLFQSPLTPEELNAYDFVLVDPPRAGALQQVTSIAASSLSHVGYVSCNPASFARDAAILQAGGFQLTQVHLLDQFLWSDHLEVLAKFER